MFLGDQPFHPSVCCWSSRTAAHHVVVLFVTQQTTLKNKDISIVNLNHFYMNPLLFLLITIRSNPRLKPCFWLRGIRKDGFLRDHVCLTVLSVQTWLELKAEQVLISEPSKCGFFCRFVCKNNGVLFENQLLQIGIKSEYRQNLGEVFFSLFGNGSEDEQDEEQMSSSRFHVYGPERISPFKGNVLVEEFSAAEAAGVHQNTPAESCRRVLVQRNTAFIAVSPTGRMYLFYGNKTSVQFASFTTTVSYPGELQSHILSVRPRGSAEADAD